MRKDTTIISDLQTFSAKKNDDNHTIYSLMDHIHNYSKQTKTEKNRIASLPLCRYIKILIVTIYVCRYVV